MCVLRAGGEVLSRRPLRRFHHLKGSHVPPHHNTSGVEQLTTSSCWSSRHLGTFWLTRVHWMRKGRAPGCLAAQHAYIRALHTEITRSTRCLISSGFPCVRGVLQGPCWHSCVLNEVHMDADAIHSQGIPPTTPRAVSLQVKSAVCACNAFSALARGR